MRVLADPVPQFDLFLVSDEDRVRCHPAVSDALPVEILQALDDGHEGVDYLFLSEVEGLVRPTSLLQLSRQGRLALGVQQPVVIGNGPQQRGVGDFGTEFLLAGSGLVAVEHFGGGVEEQYVLGLELDDGELSLRQHLPSSGIFIMFIRFPLILIDLYPTPCTP